MWLRKHDTHSKHNRLVLPIFIAKSTNGKLKLTLDRVRLQNYLDINEKLADKFMQGFYISKPVINKNPRKYNDYKVLACEYKSLIETGAAKNKADLARLLCVSRAWISKVFTIGNDPGQIN